MIASYFHNLNERLRRPGGPPLYFRITNIVVAILMIIAGIAFFTWSNFLRIMFGIFEIVFAIWIIMFELAEMTWLAPYVQFMFTWRGRGIFYVFMGCLTLGYKALGWILGAIIIGIGAAYIVLSFTAKRHENYMTGAGVAGTDTMYRDNSMAHKGLGGAGLSIYGGGIPQGQHTGNSLPQISVSQYSSDQFGHAPTVPNPAQSRPTNIDYLHSPV
ncbi:hypothetical protein H4S07_003385 [Coemansia furcata]|uniref:Uncharacterized protein n=1 Tax=Coemansia furcata TaxID=417177 RepID=A0ACC1LI19_9FUNG|nr:hypothetical protein H4S07_003385 [Coemansia furcata]